jgi:acid phosphatase type 7
MAMGLKTKLAALLVIGFVLASMPGLCADVPLFGVIGDTRIGETESVYIKFLQRMESEGISLIFVTGDVINNPGSEGQWNRFFELNGSNMTIHIAPGNHDFNNYRSLNVYRSLLKRPPYYAFSLGDTQFIVLCTELPEEAGRIMGKQLEWLKEELKEPFGFRIAFLHRPVFASAFGRGYGLDRFPGERDALHETLRSSGVNVVFAGHEHLYFRTGKDGVIYVTTGGGGAKLIAFTEENGGFFHYVVAKRQNEGYLFTVFDMNGSARDSFSIRK